MNRRTALKTLAALPAALLLPQAQAAPALAPLLFPVALPFYSPGELVRIYGWLKGHISNVTTEVVRLREPDRTGDVREPQELVAHAIYRTRNITHRKTINQERMWMAMSSKTADADIWDKVNNCEYTTPGKPGGEWVRKAWRDRKPVEVVPGVWRVGVLNGVTPQYVVEGFPNNVLMCGVGCREVVRWRTGPVVTKRYQDGFVHTYPEAIPYMGRPTLRHFGLIGLVG